AAFTASKEEDRELRTMATEFGARRDLVVKYLQKHLPGTDFVEPEGAFYLFFRADRWYDDARPDSVALCKALIEEAEVALVPGSAF
ncbi:MAG: aminotransferase class I/II-fold pyridoxal phosphate-dependent enzyme, partial [Gemmatimonadetes bacterium]|nr:aminotransferase class I/II-fold pyridoxal phosphate-dependent enzyme [Gemmatimonadota bacterium]NIQ57871.1 aminotransferase class I/II-fold pyridoxal phosphate-dependent enzyme [Gemmatimonadota bacterium]NIU78027.1 aminotransferase class I/II-fold pyridoxal phosphate-dependent enzyme [Gammaproteobacteria bacterium]NIX40024.1 aminotransferase class I/II-fold pyridoxal phosphate-dependent enzyme [Gemmatimonadota bacterium]NIX47084.1 aminotransferase class I/II-fold pyridoxal phosphate-depende